MDTSALTPDTTHESLILRWNKQAMERLRSAQFSEALALLHQAESLLRTSVPTTTSARLLGITLNNLGCYYKRRKQPNVALRYLTQALAIEGGEMGWIDRAGTQLNLCAIYSQLGKHTEGLKCAFEAFKMLEDAKTRNEEAFRPESGMRVNAATTLVIAYHNVAVELEFLRRESDAVEFYRKGVDVALAELGPDHPLTQSISANETAARSRAEDLIAKATVRQRQREGSRVHTSRRARSRQPESKLPPMKSRDRSFTAYKVTRVEEEENVSFPPYRLSTAPESFTNEHRLVIESGIAGTRRFVSPRARLQAYLH